MGFFEEWVWSGSGSWGQEEVGVGGWVWSWFLLFEVSCFVYVFLLQCYCELYWCFVEELWEFWGDIVKEFYWKILCFGLFFWYNFDVIKGKIFIEWMKGVIINICYNVLD